MSCTIRLSTSFHILIIPCFFQFWVRGLFVPWLSFCNSGANFETVYSALENNTQAFRAHYGLPSCSDAPTTDITCLSRSCPVSEASTQLQLGTFIVYIFQMVR